MIKCQSYLQNLIVFTCALLWACAPVQANADDISTILEYSKNSGYGLAKGFVGNNLSNPLPSCVDFKKDALPASQSNARVSITTNADQFKKALHIDQSAQASYLDIAKGHDEAHFGQENSSANDAFDIVIEYYSEHDGDTADNVKWIEPYNKMMTSGKAEKIAYVRDTCGDRFIQSVFREVRLFVVMHVSSTVSSSLMTVSVKTGGSVGIDPVSAAATLGGDMNVQQANQSGALTMNIVTEGFGDNTPAVTFSALDIKPVNGTDGVISIAQKLAKYMSDNRPPPGQPVRFLLSPLPGMHVDNLTNLRIIDQMGELKGKFESAQERYDNVSALLRPTDPRRRLMIQPEADSALGKQMKALGAYLDKVAKAHDTCRDTSTLATCNTAAQAIGSTPNTVPVEMPPLGSIVPSVFTFALDGVPVAPGDESLFVSSNSSSLFGTASDLKAGVKNVDLVAILPSSYISHANLMYNDLSPTFQDAVIGSAALPPQALEDPSYFPKSNGYAVIHLLHGEASKPCKTFMNDNLIEVEEACLTAVGHLFLDAAMIEAANYTVTASTSANNFLFNHAVKLELQDCFAPSAIIPIASARIDVLQQESARKTTARVFVPLPGFLIPLFSIERTASQSEWTSEKASAFNALHQDEASTMGRTRCSERVP